MRGGARVLRQPARDRPPHADAGRRRAGLCSLGPARADPVGRGGPADQAGQRALEALHRDRPSTFSTSPPPGLHFEDIRKLLNVLSRLVDQGNTVLVIEHNLDVIKSADWIVDLGPEGGDGGGRSSWKGRPSGWPRRPRATQASSRTVVGILVVHARAPEGGVSRLSHVSISSG